MKIQKKCVMNKSKLIISLIVISTSLAAWADDSLSPLPKSLPQKELSIVPMSKLNIPSELKREILLRKKQEKRQGYYEMDSDAARFLLNLSNDAVSEKMAFHGSKDKLDTHLKSSLEEIKLAFKFNVSSINQDDIIGYAPIGSYIVDMENKIKSHAIEGWSGIKVFFGNDILGTCAYSFFNLKLSHGVPQLNQDTTEYLVNSKPSSRTVEGSNNSGFFYELSWFTPTSMSQLECANKVYSKEISAAMLVLAQKIDRQK